MNIKSILIIEDHPLIAEGYKSIIKSKYPEIVFNFATTAVEALKELEFIIYDLVISDIFLPDTKDSSLVNKIQTQYPSQKILVITQGTNYQLIKLLIEMNVEALVLKESESSDIINAIEHISAGKEFYSDKVKKIASEVITKSSLRRDTNKKPTKAQFKVIQLIYNDLNNKEIASKLKVSERTIDAHCYNIYKKYGVKNRTELKSYVSKHGIMD